MANLLAYYLLNPGFVEALYDRLFELNAEILARCTATGADRTSTSSTNAYWRQGRW